MYLKGENLSCVCCMVFFLGGDSVVDEYVQVYSWSASGSRMRCDIKHFHTTEYVKGGYYFEFNVTYSM